MRSFISETIYEWSKKPYQKWFKKSPAWDIPIKKLILYPQESLGFHLGCFLLKYNFDPQPKLEDHDVFHVLTDIGVTVPEEIAMQYYLLGNGKRSAYLIAVILLGTLLYSDKIKLFRKAYKKGKAAYSFYQLDYQKLLCQPIQKIQDTFLITSL